MAVPKKKTSKAKSRSRRASAWRLEQPAAQRVPALQRRQGAPRRVRQLRLVRRPPGHRGRLTDPRPGHSAERPETASAPGDRCRSPSTPWAATTRPAPSSTVPARPPPSWASPSCWSGRPDDARAAARRPRGHRRVRRSSAWTPTPASSVRTHEGLVAGAGGRGGPRRPGVGHGLGRQHRRHDGVGACCAWAASRAWPGRPSPRRSRCPGSTPTVLLDAGANAECQPAWLVQFAQMGAVFARERYGIAEPRVGLLSIGEESTKGNPLVKETHALLAEPGALDRAGARFVGNVEGRDIMTDEVDVVVTDGFTGNVALKTLEGGMKALVKAGARGPRRHRGGRPGVRRRCCRSTPRSTPTTPAAPCCSASTGCASSATDRRRRPPIVNAVRVAPRDGRGRPGRPPPGGRVDRLSGASTPDDRSQAHKVGPPLHCPPFSSDRPGVAERARRDPCRTRPDWIASRSSS